MSGSTWVAFAAGFLLAACLAGGAALLSGSRVVTVPVPERIEVPVPVAAPPSAPAAPAPPYADPSARLDRIEARLEEIARVLAAGEEGKKDIAVSPAESTSDALGRIRTMVSSDRRGRPIDGRGVVEACDLLLGRELSARERTDALLLKGIGFRVLKDRAAEEAAFREALATAGPGTEGARSARFQLAWTEAYKGNHRVAAEAFVELSRDPAHDPSQIAWHHFSAGGEFHAAGDPESARREYETVVREYGGSTDPGTKMAVDGARRGLKALDAAGK